MKKTCLINFHHVIVFPISPSSLSSPLPSCVILHSHSSSGFLCTSHPALCSRSFISCVIIGLHFLLTNVFILNTGPLPRQRSLITPILLFLFPSRFSCNPRFLVATFVQHSTAGDQVTQRAVDLVRVCVHLPTLWASGQNLSLWIDIACLQADERLNDSGWYKQIQVSLRGIWSYCLKLSESYSEADDVLSGL